MRRSLGRTVAWLSGAVGLVLGLLLVPSGTASAHGFADTPAMVHARAAHSIALLSNGEVLVAGGYEFDPGSPVASAEIYDPLLNSWQPAASLNTARASYRLTSLPDGRVLATGGETPNPTATTELYDPVFDSWTPAAPLATARRQHSATLLPSGDVLVCGGSDTGSDLASCERYDPLSDLWHPAASLLFAGGNQIATLLPSGEVLMTGNLLEEVEIYDPVADVWTEVASMAVSREGYTATLLPSGSVLVAGGEDNTGVLGTAETYSPDADTWTPAASMSALRLGATATALPNGDVLVAGGNLTSPDAEIFDVANATWRSAGDMFQTRGAARATALENGDVLIVGGRSSGQPISSVERYVVVGADTFLDVSTQPDPSLVGQPYLVTVTVSAQSGTPTGSIEASDPFGATCGPAVLVDGVAACELVAVSDGPHQVTAVYTPDTPYFEPGSLSVSHDVVEADTHLSIVSHTPEPSLPGEPITITVDFGVTPPGSGSPHGAIFVDDGVDTCLIPEGETGCMLTPITRGPITLTANYSGDGDFNPSSDSVTHHVNELPISGDDVYEIFEDTSLAVTAADGVLANDVDPDGDALFVTTIGALPVDGIGGTVEMAADGSFTYTPPPDANGSASFGYAVSDGLEESFGLVTIAVGAVNDPPEFVLGPSPSLPAGSKGPQSIVNFAQVTSMGPPDEQDQSVLAWPTRTISDANGVLAGSPSIALDGTLQFSLSGHGGVATIGVALQDNGGVENGGQDTSAEQTFLISVAPGADLSVSIDDGTTFAVGGDPLLYLIVVRNTGPDDANGAQVHETLSPNLVDATWTCTASAGANCSPSGTGAIDDPVNLPAGAIATYELTATVAANPEAAAENDVQVVAPSTVTDFNPANNESSDWDVTGIFADGFDMSFGG